MSDLQPVKITQITSQPTEKIAGHVSQYDPRIKTADPLPNENAHWALMGMLLPEGNTPTSEKDLIKLKSIYDWGRASSKSEDPAEVIRAINRLESRLGAPKLGVSRLNHVYQYIKIDGQIRALEAERERMSF